MPKVSEAYLEARRQEILDAATRCFARRGVHRATMQDIVAESGLSPGAIYRYFAGKDDLIEAIADRRHARERLLFDGAVDVGDLPELGRALLDGMDDPVGWEDRLVGIEIWAASIRNQRLLRLVVEGNREPLRRISEHVAKAQESGAIPAALEPEAVARLAIAAFYGFVLQKAWARADGEDLDPGATLAVVDWLTGRLLEGTPRSGS